MTATITITRDQLAYVLLNLGLATTATGRTDEVFAALRAKAAADAAADAWDRVPATGDTGALGSVQEEGKPGAVDRADDAGVGGGGLVGDAAV